MSTDLFVARARAPRMSILGPAAVLLAFTLSLPTATGSAAALLFLVAWLLCGGWAWQWRRLRASPTALWATALLLMFVLGMAYSSGTRAQQMEVMGKYAKLLLVPVLIVSVGDGPWRRRALQAFLWGAVLASALSYARFFGLVPGRWSDSIVQGHIHFGTIEAFAAYAFARMAFEPGRRRPLWVLLAALLAFDVVYVGIARTGYVIVLALIVLLGAQRLGARGLLAGGGLALLLAVVAFSAFPVARMRMEQGVQNLRQYQRAEADHDQNQVNSSWGLRLQFWSNTLRIIAQHPLVGSGTGSMDVQYTRVAPHDLHTSNPHNEYLNSAEQLGAVGLLLLLGMAAAAWRDARGLDRMERDFAHGVLVTIGVGSLFNSLLMDVNEGRFLVVMLGLLLAASLGTGRR
ncbi:MAG: O-antigen ligase family protein, partial [Betaproteobacteria bacterium]|nr:O-antigen ligase family protein [Betaproteobacteria bacterium]